MADFHPGAHVATRADGPAVIVATTGAEVTCADLATRCPVSVDFVDELPRLPTGELVK